MTRFRIYKAGPYWLVRYGDMRWAFWHFSTAKAAVSSGMQGLDPLPNWIAETLEPAGV